MKLKAAITDGAPAGLIEAFGSKQFAIDFLNEVVIDVFKADCPGMRPAEFYVQKPDITIGINTCWGVELRLTGVSRGGRAAHVFHQALKALKKLAKRTILKHLPEGEDVQIFVVLMIDGDVETSPGSGTYTSVLETEPVWVNHDEPSDEADIAADLLDGTRESDAMT